MRIVVVGAAGMVGSRVVSEAVNRGHDLVAVFRRTRPVPGREHIVAATTTALLDAAAKAGTRVLVVGGASPLRVPDDPGLLVLDSPRYVPPEIRTIAAASAAQLDACLAHPASWVYLSPPALLEPGTRTGEYRRGTTTLIADADGTSRISAEDLAVAVLDELENPCGDRHLTVGY